MTKLNRVTRLIAEMRVERARLRPGDEAARDALVAKYLQRAFLIGAGSDDDEACDGALAVH